jgi:YD repeat-containing protein
VEYREWWEINIDGDTMNWTALRQNDDGTTFDVTFQMSKASADNVRLTQTYGVIAFSSGKLMSSITADYVWEDGLLRSSHTSTLMHMSGKVTELDDTYVYDDDGNCIELHHVSGQTATSNTDAYFTYDEQGRMTAAVEKNGDSEITVQTTITAYTDDDFIQAMTVEHFNSGTVAEYQFIWENGDLTGLTRHFRVPDDKEDITVTFEYDDYPNHKAGIPISSAVFDPEMIADRGSAHNRCILDNEYSYSNGRLVKTSSPAFSALITTTYLTYSDGTTGKDN